MCDCGEGGLEDVDNQEFAHDPHPGDVVAMSGLLREQLSLHADTLSPQ